MKNYIIHRAGAERELGEVTISVHDDNKQYWLSPVQSLAIRNHSPDGFEFGYGGSGPSQLSLAILLDFTNDQPLSLSLYQQFKYDFIISLGHPGGTILGNDIQAWLDKNRSDKSI